MKRFATLFALAATMTVAAGTASADTQYERVEAYDTDVFLWDADGTGYATFSITGDGDTDLDLYVYDGDGNLMDYDVSFDDCEMVTVFVEDCETYIIEVRNLGGVWNGYALTID